MSSNVQFGLVAAVVAGMFFAGVASVSSARPPEGKGKPEKAEAHKEKKKTDRAGQKTEMPSVRAGISSSAARDLALGAGVTGYDALPPGIQKNLSRGKPLPPGIAKRALPSSMLQRLPSYPGYEWLALGRDLVLVESATSLVADVLSGIFQ